MNTEYFWVSTDAMVTPHYVQCIALQILSALKKCTILYIKLRGLSPRANYTDRAAAAGRRS